MDHRRITDGELRSLEELLQVLIKDFGLVAGLSILEREEIERTCATVRSLIGKSGSVRDQMSSAIPDPEAKE